jgi:hypothetical protein
MLKKDTDIVPPSTQIPAVIEVLDPSSRKAAVLRNSQRSEWIAKQRTYLLEKSLNQLLKKHKGTAPDAVPPADMISILKALSVLDPTFTLDLTTLLG